MTVNVEKMRFDIAETQRQAERNQRWETRRFVVSILLASAALLGAGAAIGNYFTRSNPTAAPAQFIQLPPGTVITIPPKTP